MKIVNNVKMILPAKSGNESFARASVAAFCANAAPTVEEINDIKTAVSEAVTNVIVHAYPEVNGEMMIDVTLYDDKVVEITVTDEGQGIQNYEEARKPFFTTKSEEEHSGMGFTIMEAFTDEMEVMTVPGRGTTVKMRKKIGKHA